MIQKLWKHFWLVNKHRFLVFVHCCKVGLFWQGLVHDLSKYSLEEFWESAKYYTGKGSPISNCRKQNGYSRAWLHHKGRNKHHIEYWYDKENKVQTNIPYRYAAEIVCDKLSATKTYRGKDYALGDALAHWNAHREKQLTNENMLQFFDKVFLDLKDYGEKYILNKKYLKKTYDEVVLNQKQEN